MDVDKCVAYKLNSCMRINWDTEVSTISVENIAIAELNDDIKHNCEKKSLTFSSCDSCNKRFLFNCLVCTKCNYTVCQSVACRDKFEWVVCVPGAKHYNRAISSRSNGSGTSG